MSAKFKNRSLIYLIILLAVCLCFSIGLGQNVSKPVFSEKVWEDITGNYGFKKGAQIKLKDAGSGVGIRFELQLKETYYESLQTEYASSDLEFGVIVALNQTSLDSVTYENAVDANNSNVKKVTTSSSFSFDNGFATRRFAFVFNSNKHIYDDMTVRAYIKPSTAPAIYADFASFEDDTRSMSAIANCALLDGEVEHNDVEDYLGTVSGLTEEKLFDKSTASLTVDLGESLENAKVYNGVNRVYGATINGNVLTLPASFESGEGSLSVVANNKVVNFDYICADKVFTQDNKDEIVSTFVKNNGSTNNGYYVLGSNIDGISFKRTKQDTFCGVFDGRGYYIKNMSVVGKGLFGDYGNGITIKNVAFIDMDFGAPKWENYGLLNTNNGTVTTASIENVYISVKEITATTTTNNSANLTYFAPLAYRLSRKDVPWHLNNIIIDIPVASSVTVNNSWSSGFAVYGDFSSAENIANCYVISPLKTMAQPADNAFNIIKYNNEADMLSASRNYSSFDDVWCIANKLPAWKSYVQLAVKNSENLTVDTDELIISKGSNEVYTFTFNYGERTIIPTAINLPDGCTELVVDENTVKAGVISIEDSITVEVVYGDISKTVDIKVTPFQEVSTVVDLDTTNGKIYLPSEFNAKTISDVNFNGSSVYSAGIIAGIVPTIKADRSDVESITLVVDFTDDTSIKFTNVKPYTAIFTQDNKDTIASTFASNTKTTNSGYYILKENISGVSFNAKEANLNTFSGVFDGRGYTISMSVVGYGLFGYIGDGATVKNVAFNMDFGKPTWNAYGLFYTPVSGIKSATLENIYINVKEITGLTAYGSNALSLTYFAPIGKSNDAPWKIKNVITNVSIDSAVSINASWCGSIMVVEKFNNCSSVSNLYSISNRLDIVNNSSQWTAYNGTFKNNIKKYSSVQNMINAQNDYSGFKDSGYWTVETGNTPVWSTFPVE